MPSSLSRAEVGRQRGHPKDSLTNEVMDLVQPILGDRIPGQGIGRSQ